MRRFLLRRLIRAVIVLWGISTIVFVVMHLSGDPVTLLLPQDATRADIERVTHQLGLDKPLWTQYVIFMANLARLDFGTSIHLRQPAFNLALERLPATFELAAAAFCLAVAVAVPIGVLAAMKPYSPFDSLAMLFAAIGQSAPTFFLGIMLILVFSLRIGYFPTSGRGGLDHLVLPAITLGAYAMASIARLTRAAMLEVIRKDYIRTARAKGIAERVIVWRHAFKNTAIPVVTIMGIQLGALLGGAVVTETVFSWPGIGRLAIQSIYNRDYAVVQATVFLTAFWFVLINFAVDVIYGWLDPRIRYS
ncbi:MAG TPA: ABC transporter permease [Candidatus Methylomirabilis sp.]|nr:ABC transporter permease [Candidatus Methylomirabilis sp.]